MGVLALAGAVVASIVSAPAPIVGSTDVLDDGTVGFEGVPAAPAALAAGAGVEPNRYALARVVQSELGSGPRVAREGIAWAVVNEARARGMSVLALVTRAGRKVNGAWTPHPTGDGFFGRQAQGRFVASSQDPGAAALEVADGVMSGEIEDPTDGARQFDSPKAFGVQEGTTAAGADEVAARRIAAGNELVLLPGVPESTLRFWRPA